MSFDFDQKCAQRLKTKKKHLYLVKGKGGYYMKLLLWAYINICILYTSTKPLYEPVNGYDDEYVAREEVAKYSKKIHYVYYNIYTKS